MCNSSQLTWLRKDNFTKEIEGLAFAAQDRFSLPMQSKHIFTSYHALLNVDFVFVALLMKPLTI